MSATDVAAPSTAPAPEHGGASKLPLAALTALVIGSMVGGGIFSLPSQMAMSAAPIPLVLGWLVTGVGMLMLAFVFQRLADRKPDVDGGVYGYARAGFGDYVGFTSAWGYWISAFIGNVGYMVLLFSTLGYFFPAFAGGNTLAAVVGASVLLWLMHALVLLGVRQAAFVNTLATIAKIVPLVTFLVLAAVAFKSGIFTADVWGTSVQIDGESIGGTVDQIKNMMLVTVWVFIGIEGASIYSARAKNRSDVGRATVLGFVAVLLLLVLVNLLSYGIMAQAKLAGLDDPSLAGVLQEIVGPWGAAFVSIGLTVSLLGALLAWLLLSAEVLRLPALDHVMPMALAKENRNGAPANALWLTNGAVQLMLVWTYFNESTYLNLILLATSLILLPYLWSAAYQVIVAIRERGAAGAKGSDLVVGILALVYSLWLVYAGGLKYVLVAAAFYLVGTAVFIWARTQAKEKVFRGAEPVLVGVVAVGGVVAIIGLASGWLTI